MHKPPLALIILDGWGHSDEPEANAIFAAKTPHWDKLWDTQPKTLIHCSGTGVGLPKGQMGNSEVGHMTLGAGRVIYQNFTRINAAIDDGSFDDNPAYLDAIDKVLKTNKALHVFGLLSPGGVHSHEDHIVAIIELAAKKGVTRLFLHAFLDGRDTPPRSARQSIEKLEQKFADLGVGQFATISGRYYAMDRDQRWERTQLAWQALVAGKSDYRADSALNALERAYMRNENDEFVMPTVIHQEHPEQKTTGLITDGDAVIFMNFRPDRARQITRAFVQDDFGGFPQPIRPGLADFVMTTNYADDIAASCAFSPQTTVNSIGEYLSDMGKTQLRIAETEKYAHVTFFFSAGREAKFPGEDRILIPSPDVATYDLQPEMNAPQLTDALISAIKGGTYDTIICNFANGDMVGHTGVFDAAVKAVEALDQCLGKIIAALDAVGGQCLITADHGNVEKMRDQCSGETLTSHTIDPVPLVYFGPQKIVLNDNGSLADVAPTMLALLNIPTPAEMTGQSLLASI